MRCQSCQLAAINGVVCHEKGCPDAWKTWARECNWCGAVFLPSHVLQYSCDESCAASYRGDCPDLDVVEGHWTCHVCGLVDCRLHDSDAELPDVDDEAWAELDLDSDL